jgi:clathrin heavy chain
VVDPSPPRPCSEKYGLAYVISKMGLLFVYDVQNLTAVYRQRISADPVFLACAAPSTGGVYAITRRGSVLSVSVNSDTMVPFISTSLKNVELAIRVATRGGLPGAEPLFQQKFETVRTLSLRIASLNSLPAPDPSMQEATDIL